MITLESLDNKYYCESREVKHRSLRIHEQRNNVV